MSSVKSIATFVLCFIVIHVYGQPMADSKPTSSQFEFISNHGQWHPLVRYKMEIPFGTVYLENDAILYNFYHPEDYHQIHDILHKHNLSIIDSGVIRKHAIRLRFSNIENSPRPIESGQKTHYFNYFLGDDESRWKSGIHPCSQVTYPDIQPNIDLEFIADQGLKYQWVVRKPTSEAIQNLACNIEGATDVEIVDGQLWIHSTVGILKEEKPYVYQIIEGNKVEVLCSYQLEGNTLRYKLAKPIDPRYPLIIDPKLIFSTYSGSFGDNFGFTATYDANGNLYAGGIVDASENKNYPVTSGAYDETWNLGWNRSPANLACDISISKYDSSGKQLLWATYLGGKDDEYPHSLVVDRNNELIVFGTTFSSNFPTSIKAFDNSYAGQTDIIVSKFSEDGKFLRASTYVGGAGADGFNSGSPLHHNYADDFRGDVIFDDDNHIFVATCTQSDSMPAVNAFSSKKTGILDGYAFELSPDFSNLLWATYVGGSGRDAFYSIKLDQSNNIFLGGGTNSINLPSTDSVYAPSNAGGADGFITNFNKSTKDLKRLTYWGTGAYDQIYFIDLDNKGNVYATGQTAGNIAKTNGTYGQDNKGQFIFKMDTALRDQEFITTFGNTNNRDNLVPSAFLVDVCEHIYFSGWASKSSNNFAPGTENMQVSSDAEQTETDEKDFYIMVLDKNAKGLLYATYFGGDTSADHVDGGTSRFDKKGVIYQSVCASCPPNGRTGYNDFPVSPDAAFTKNVSVRCSNASFKIDLQIKTAVVADFVANPVIGCKPLKVDFENRSVLGETLLWDFGEEGDDDTSTLINPSYEYLEPGLYTVTLTVIDSNTCNISDQYIRTVLVIDQGLADFEASYDICTDKLSITNKSIEAYSYLWNFGDGNFSEDADPEHRYEEAGSYDITLIINDGSLCADSLTIPIDINRVAEEDFKLYNVFTPNNDNLNDCFRFDGLNKYCDEIEWTIYNRWGEKLFETNDPEACWDGRSDFTGDPYPEGTYFYILNLNPKEVSSLNLISGIVSLIR